MTRSDAYDLVCQFTQSDSLRKHMLAVETAMRAYAQKLVEDGREEAIESQAAVVFTDA